MHDSQPRPPPGEERNVPEERHRQAGGRDRRDAVGELVVDAAQEVDDEVLIGEGCADVAQLVRQVLELVAVLDHREVTLAEGVERLA